MTGPYDKIVQIEFYDEKDPDEMIGFADFVVVVPRKGDTISMLRKGSRKPDGSTLYQYKVKKVDFWFHMNEHGVMEDNQQVAITLEEIEDEKPSY